MIYTYLIVIAVMSDITAIGFTVDKSKAKRGSARIPEMVLLSLASFGGSLGAMFGMYVVRHKTNPIEKFHFAITAWLALATQVVIALLLLA
ncbi:MAG: DUF1294 domain-containing protein [Clostridia bacterium]|nr:DUF1294 domain-containing protein [Clostridia bacterium]